MMPHYSNKPRFDMSGHALFGSALAASPTGPFTRNSEWPQTVFDFSGYAVHRVQSSVNTTNWGGVLITPRTVVAAWHTFPDMPVGSQFVFKAPNGDELTRTVTATSASSGPMSVIGGDIYLLTLDSTPTGCKVYPIPTLASITSIVGSTIITPSRERILETRTFSSINGSNYIVNTIDANGDTNQDSGQPVFTTRANELVLLGTHHFSTSFPSLAHNLAAIQSYCDTIGETINTVSVDPADWAEPLAAQLQDATA